MRLRGRWCRRRARAFTREPDAARPTGPRGSSTDKRQPRRSVLEPSHWRVPRGTRPVLGQLVRLPKPAHQRQTRGAGEGTPVTRGHSDSPVTPYRAKSGHIVPQVSGSSSLSGKGSSFSESRAPDSYSRIGITTYRVCIVPGAWMRQLLFESVSPICTLSPSIALSASRR